MNGPSTIETAVHEIRMAAPVMRHLQFQPNWFYVPKPELNNWMRLIEGRSSCCTHFLGTHEVVNAIDEAKVRFPTIAQIANKVGIVDSRATERARSHLAAVEEGFDLGEECFCVCHRR